MDYELREQGTSLVGKSAVPVYQRVQIAEFLYRKIGGQSRLNALFAVDTHPYMCRLNQCHIVAPITYS